MERTPEPSTAERNQPMNSIPSNESNSTGLPTDSNADSLTPVELAKHYRRKFGWTVIPVEPMQKAPGYDKWERTRYESDEDIERAFARHPWSRPNISVLLGKPSNNLIDIDLDIREAARLAPAFLPKTGMSFGRASKPDASHYFYTATDKLPKTTMYKLPIKEAGKEDAPDYTMILEFRANMHTVIPPSTYWNDSLRWMVNTEPPKVDADALKRSVSELAAAAALAHVWPAQGSRHEAALAVAGGLLSRGWDVDRATNFLRLVCSAAGEDPEEIKNDRLLAVRTTAEQITEGKPHTSWTRLSELLPYDNGMTIVRHIVDWLGLDWTRALDPKAEAALTDVGNALLLERKYGNDLKFTPEGGWYSWTGSHWSSKEGSNRARQLAMQLGIEIDLEASQLSDATLKQRMEKHANRSRSERAVKAALSLAEALPAFARSQTGDVDSPEIMQGFLNTQSGIVNLRTGELLPHDRDKFITNVTRAPYAPPPPGKVVVSPEWLQVLDLMTVGDQELQAFLKRAVGASLIGGNPADYLFIMKGVGGTGKTTFLGAIANVLGTYSTSVTDKTFFRKTSGDGPVPELADLVGKRWIYVDEVDRQGLFEEGMLKRLTGGSRYKTRRLYRAPFEFTLDGPIWIITNHSPNLSADDTGIWRRVKFIELPSRPEAEVKWDDRIRQRLTDPRTSDSTILAWAIEGAAEWYVDRDLGVPKIVIEATQALRASSDSMLEFVDECLVRDDTARIQASDLLGLYNNWTRQRNHRQQNMKTFGPAVARVLGQGVRKGSYVWYYGVRMRRLGDE